MLVSSNEALPDSQFVQSSRLLNSFTGSSFECNKMEEAPESVGVLNGKRNGSLTGQVIPKVPNSALYHNKQAGFNRNNSESGKIDRKQYIGNNHNRVSPPAVQPKPISNGDYGRFKQNGAQKGNGFTSNNQNCTDNGFVLPNPNQDDYDETSIASSNNSTNYNGWITKNGNNHARTNSLFTVNGSQKDFKNNNYYGANSVTSINSSDKNLHNPSASTESINGRYRAISIKVSKHNSSEHLVNNNGLNRPIKEGSSRKAVSQNYLNNDCSGPNSIHENPFHDMLANEHQLYSTYNLKEHTSHNSSSGVNRKKVHQVDYNPLNVNGYLGYNDVRHHKSEIALPTVDSDHRASYDNGGISSRHYESSNTFNDKSGPSYRRIQNIQGTCSNNAKRFPSDTNLHMNSSRQIYTSGKKPGPVTIPARSRSAQPSPSQSPRNSSPHFGSTHANNIRLIEENDDYQILPSVREIIRQVEAMTNQDNNSVISSVKKNVLTATNRRDLTANTISSAAKMKSSEDRFRSPIARHNSVSGETKNHTSQITVNRSNSANRSAPKNTQPLSSLETTSNSSINNGMNNSTSYFMAINGPNAPPIPPHAPLQMNGTKISSPIKNRADVKNNLPTDYLKLREAFLEQRREIQRLRKEINDKDAEISQLRSDIRLYEPWH